jgi:clan AA aspartic protease (TIGR02281 family)
MVVAVVLLAQCGQLAWLRMFPTPTTESHSVVVSEISLKEDDVGTLFLPVSLNGCPDRYFCLDTGAASLMLPYAVAKSAGLDPDAPGRQVTITLADGKEVIAKGLTIAKVRVGDFELKDIPCTVMPKDSDSMTPILGNSILRGFVATIDYPNKTLKLERSQTLH